MKRLFCCLLSIIVLFSMTVPNTVLAGDFYSDSNVQHGSIHDPSIVKDAESNKYYAFGSHIAYAESDNLIDWTNADTSINTEFTNLLSLDGKSWKENLSEPLAWTSNCQKFMNTSEEKMEYNCWAADVIYNKTMNKYCMYACCSVWGTCFSVIFLAVADSIDGPYTYADSFIYSGFKCAAKNNSFDDFISYENTNVGELIEQGYLDKKKVTFTRGYKWCNYDNFYDCSWGKCPNAIDPTAFTDSNGDMWLVYGSFSGGCFVQKLDNATGLPDYQYMKDNAENGYDPYFGKRISTTNEATDGTGEGPYIIYDSVTGYYYFFLTYGGLGGDGGYNIREYRSKSPDGPYKDVSGFDANDTKNTGLKISCNYQFSCNSTAYLSGGHSSCLIDDDSTMYQAYHTRFLSDNGWGHQIRVHQMLRTGNGWAVMLPYEYQGEKVNPNGYDESEIIGDYEFIDSTNITHSLSANSKLTLSDIVVPTQYITLNADGTISGAKDFTSSKTNANTGSKSVSGSWTKQNNSYYAVFKIGNVTYNGVFCKQKEETNAAKEVMTFAGAGNDNSTIMAVKHTHNPVSASNAVKATCQKAGKTTDTICSVCKKVLKSGKTLPKSEHKIVKDKAVAATYVKAGKTEGSHCSVCKTVIKEQKTVKKLTLAKPSAVKISAVSKGFKLSWKKAKDATGYQIQYSTSKNFKNAKTVTVNKNKTSATVKKLKSKKTYYVKIRSYKTVKVNGKSQKVYSSWVTKSVKSKK